MQPSARPIQSIRIGAIAAAIWMNEINVRGKTVRVLRATLERRYRDPASGTWKSSASFSRHDLPAVCFAVMRTFDAMTDADDGDELAVEEEAVR